MAAKRRLIPVLGAAAVLAHHAAWFAAFPQYRAYPPDQSGYLTGGRILLAAFSTVLHQGFVPRAVEEIRRWFDFFGVALLYGSIDAIKPDSLVFMRGVLAFFNALSAIGAWSLARRLAGPVAGGAALLFFVASPAFPSGASRLYADPVTGCLIVWGLRLFMDSDRCAHLGGLLVGAALLIRVQLLPWIPLGLAGLTAIAWIAGAGPGARSRIKMGWTGLGVPLLAFALLTHYGLENRNDSAPKHNLPRYHYYAYGVWQYLESDGWEGPYRLKQDPFYKALVQEAQSDPVLLTSRPRQYVFAARYMGARLDKAVPIVLGNFYRVFDRPQNPEHRGFIPPEASTLIHRFGILCALIAAAQLFASGSPALLAPLLILSLGAFHAMAWGWPRYLMPVLPTLLALSGVGFEALIGSLRKRRGPWLAAGGAILMISVAGSALRGLTPETAWALRVIATLAGISAVLLLSRSEATQRSLRASLAIAMVACVIVFGDAWRDQAWHAVAVPLAAGDVVRQTITLDDPALVHLREAHDRYLGVDLEMKDPSREPWALAINGVPAPLLPTIPPLPESIPVPLEARTYPQWWVAKLTDEMIERARGEGSFVVDLRVDDPAVARLNADVFPEQGRVFEAPSLGDWPYAAGIKPEYDRDFRLVEKKELASRGSKTLLLRGGATRILRAMARIRVFELDDVSGRVVFEAQKAAPVRSPKSLLAFGARAAMRDRGPAELSIGGVPVVPFHIATFRPTSWTAGDFRLCYRDRTPNRSEAYESRGIYLLSGPMPCSDATCEVAVRFWPGMDDRPMSFGLEPARSQPSPEALRTAASECSFEGAINWTFGRVIDGTTDSYPTDRGRWRVARIY